MSEFDQKRPRPGDRAETTPETGSQDRLVEARQRRLVQRKAERKAAGAAPAIPQSSGAPLEEGVRAKMEGSLQADLSSVRVHTGGDSARAASNLGAKAFTVEKSVHFGAGQFAPGTEEGDRLLAHELTHVVQGQRGGVQRKAHDDRAVGDEVSQPGDASEKEADQVADSVAGRLHGRGGGGTPARIRESQQPVARAADEGAAAPEAASGKEGAAEPAGEELAAKVGTADYSCQVSLDTPAEAVITSVTAEQKPRFSTHVVVPFELIESHITGGKDLNPDELRAVSSVSLFKSPNKASQLTFTPSAAGLELDLSELEGPQAVNASEFLVTLANGKSYSLAVSCAQFHCDETLWKKKGLELQIAQQQGQVDELTQRIAAEQDTAAKAHADPATQGELVQATTAVATAEAQVAKRLAALKKSFTKRDPSMEAVILSFQHGRPEMDGLAQKVPELEKLCAQRSQAADRLDTAQQLATGIQEANQGKAPSGESQQALDKLNANVADAKQNLDAIQQQIDALRAEIQAQLDKDDALFTQLVTDAQTFLPLDAADQGGAGARETLQDLQLDVELRKDQVQRLQDQIEQQTAGVQRDAAQSEAIQSDLIKVANERMAKAQEELAQVKGPLFVMLGPDGGELKPLPEADPKAQADKP